MNLFIDIDGVLLGKSPETNRPTLATHAKQFVEYVLDRFDCYWLTTHCKGSTDTAIDYLAPYSDPEFLTLIQKIKPTNYKTFKTEALFGDFLWIDDQPSAYEFQYLEENNLLRYWLQVNTRHNINALNQIITDLKSYGVSWRGSSTCIWSDNTDSVLDKLASFLW